MYEELVKAAEISQPYKHIKVDVEEQKLPMVLSAFKMLRFSGLNVTLPHKLAVIPILDEVDEVVQELGAVNTIKFGNVTSGHNTDWLGIYEPLKSIGREISTVTIFGSGGAARAAIYAARRLGAGSIYVHYRNESDNSKTENLKNRAQELRITLHDYSEVIGTVRKSDLIINATSAGMVGRDKLPFDLAKIKHVDVSNKLYLDVVFNPIDTPLLKYFNDRGAKTIDGLWMMIYQGIAALEIWLDRNIVVSNKELQRIHALLIKELHSV
jgi:shikimate dehydrogenase